MTNDAEVEADKCERCPTCMQPVPMPQRGDHDYGLPLVARNSDASEVERLRAIEKAARDVTTTHLWTEEDRKERRSAWAELVAALAVDQQGRDEP